MWLRAPIDKCAAPRGYHRFQSWTRDVHGSQLGHQLQRDITTGDVTGIAKTRLIIKGTGLSALRGEGMSDFDALHLFHGWDGDCTRIDLAIDVLHPKVTPKAFHELHQNRHMVTRLSVPTLMGDKDAGQTFYLRGRGQQVRVYDKSSERSRKGGASLPAGITRMELQLRGRWARRAYRDLLNLEPNAWDSEFPRFVGGLFLSKVRPTQGPRPDRNPQRAPVWTPLADALQHVKPVRLSTEEVHRAFAHQLANKLAHFGNQLSFMQLMERILGTPRFLQAVRHGTLDGAAMHLAAFALENPAQLQAALKAVGLDDLLSQHDDQGPIG